LLQHTTGIVCFGWGLTATTYNAFWGWECTAPCNGTCFFGLGSFGDHMQWHIIFFGWDYTFTSCAGTWFSMVGNLQLQHAMDYVSVLGAFTTTSTIFYIIL